MLIKSLVFLQDAILLDRLGKHIVLKHKKTPASPKLWLQNRYQSLPRKYSHVTPLLHEQTWLPLKELLTFRDLVLTYKCLNNFASSYLSNKFCKRSDVHGRETRQRQSLHILLFRTAAGQRTITCRAVNLWTCLDIKIKNAESLNSFKTNLRNHLLLNFNHYLM